MGLCFNPMKIEKSVDGMMAFGGTNPDNTTII